VLLALYVSFTAPCYGLRGLLPQDLSLSVRLSICYTPVLCQNG